MKDKANDLEKTISDNLTKDAFLRNQENNFNM